MPQWTAIRMLGAAGLTADLLAAATLTVVLLALAAIGWTLSRDEREDAAATAECRLLEDDEESQLRLVQRLREIFGGPS